LSAPRCCPYCQRIFVPSIYRPQQAVCSPPSCQRRRRADYHRKKLVADAVYRQVVRESQQQWWTNILTIRSSADSETLGRSRLIGNGNNSGIRSAASSVFQGTPP
jgi:hypothetical protein